MLWRCLGFFGDGLLNKMAIHSFALPIKTWFTVGCSLCQDFKCDIILFPISSKRFNSSEHTLKAILQVFKIISDLFLKLIQSKSILWTLTVSERNTICTEVLSQPPSSIHITSENFCLKKDWDIRVNPATSAANRASNRCSKTSVATGTSKWGSKVSQKSD